MTFPHVARYLATAAQRVEVVDESGAAAAGPTFTTKVGLGMVVLCVAAGISILDCCSQHCGLRLQWLHLTAPHPAGQAQSAGAPVIVMLQMLHAFLPPVDVELSVQFGGHTEAGSDL